MEDDFRPQVKKVAVAMGASLTEQDFDRMPQDMKTRGDFIGVQITVLAVTQFFKSAI